FPEGTLTAQVIGRALDREGRYSADTTSQEHYVEDQFQMPPDLQAALAHRLAEAGTERGELPDALRRLVPVHAHLGMLDVQPLDNPLQGRETGPAQIAFRAQRIAETGKRKVWQVEGTSEVESRLDQADRGAVYDHSVRLTWKGFLELDGDRIARLVLSAE